MNLGEAVIKILSEGLSSCSLTCPEVERCDKADLICFKKIRELLEVSSIELLTKEE